MPAVGGDRAAIIAAVVAAAQADMAADRKTTALKALQVGSPTSVSLDADSRMDVCQKSVASQIKVALKSTL